MSEINSKSNFETLNFLFFTFSPYQPSLVEAIQVIKLNIGPEENIQNDQHNSFVQFNILNTLHVFGNFHCLNVKNTIFLK